MKILIVTFCLITSLCSQGRLITFFTDFSSMAKNQTSFINPNGELFDIQNREEIIKLNTFYSSNLFTVDFNLSHISNNFDNNSILFQIRETYFEFSINESTDLFIGRKLFRQGAGYYKNPTGFLNSQKDAGDVNDLVKKNVGRDAIGINIYFENSDLEIVYTPAYTTKNTLGITGHELTAKYYLLYGNSDISLLYNFHSSFKDRMGISLARTFNDYLELHSEASFQQGSDIYYHEVIDPSSEFRIYQSSPYTFKKSDPAHLYFLGGINISTFFGLNIISEYVYDSQGLSKKEWKRLVNYAHWLKNFCGTTDLKAAVDGNTKWVAQSLNQQKEYLFYRLAQPVKDLTISFIGIHNLYDNSAVLISALDYSYKDAYFKIQSTWFTGNGISDWGSLLISNEVSLSFILYI